MSQSSPTQTLWRLTAGQRVRYGAAMLAMAIGTVFYLLIAYFIAATLDALIEGNATFWGTIVPATVAIIGANAIHGVFTYIRGKWAAEASENIVRDLRHRLYSHLERLPCSYHDHADTGDLVQRCSSDVDTVRMFLASQVVEIARVALFVIVALPIMVTQDLRMSAITLGLVPVIVVAAVLFFRQVRGLFKNVDESEGELTTVVQENLTGIRVVRAFSQQKFEIEKFRRHNDEFRNLEFRLFIALGNYWAFSDLLCFAQMGLVLLSGGLFVAAGELSLGQWVLFWWLLRQIIWPVRHIGRVLADTGKATIAIERIQEVLDAELEDGDEIIRDDIIRDDTAGEQVSGDIVIRDLTFSFGDAAPAVDHLSLTINEGETVALLGAPGAGKSTLVNLLVRLYEYNQGEIQIGGADLHSLNRHAVRDAFGMVLQDPFLYSKTVRDNVLVGRGNAAQHEVEESARAADVHGNIVEFEEGYDTMVGERGVTLSGGQRQRLAIARALLKNAAFLVLDDSLSAVDTKTEAHILRALAERRGRRTTVLIAHRLSSTRLADTIVVMDHGRIVQQGTHDELLAEEGEYRRLWKIQGDLETEIERDLSRAKSE